MATNEEIISSFTPTEEKIEENTQASPHISIKDAVTAFETIHKFLQQDNDCLELDYNETKVFHRLKKKISLYNSKNLNQGRTTSYFNN